MTLDRDTVDRIARLARIHLQEDETVRYQEELSRILGLVEQMNAVATDAVEPLSHPLGRGLRLREDTVTETDQRDAFQDVAPAVEDGLYLVPRVIE